MNKTGKGYFKKLDIDEVKFRQMYEEGLPIIEIAKEFKVLKTSINKMIKRRGISKRHRSKTIYKKDKHWNWEGGKVKISGGYIIIKDPQHPLTRHNGYVLEHRLVMEKMIGRHLSPIEVVDHIN